jgi:hypothetical protein
VVPEIDGAAVSLAMAEHREDLNTIHDVMVSFPSLHRRLALRALHRDLALSM